MRVNADNLPMVGARSKCLGVREPPSPNADIDVDVGGNVVLNRRGLSVVADWRLLPGHLIPEHLESEFNGASGKGMQVFVHGEGAFIEEAVAAGLLLLHKPKNDKSGNVAPSASVALAQFQSDIQATRPHWRIAES